MAEGDLTGPQIASAANEAGVGNGVVGSAKWSAGNQRAVGRKVPADAVYLGYFQRFFRGQIGEDARQRAR